MTQPQQNRQLPHGAIDLHLLAANKLKRQMAVDQNTLSLATNLFAINFHFTIEGKISVNQLSILCIEGAKVLTRDIEEQIRLLEINYEKQR